MSKLPGCTIALILSVAGVSVFSLLCATAIQFQGGDLRIRFEAPGGIKVDAGVNKGQGTGEDEKLSLPEDEKADRCLVSGAIVPSETS